MSEIGEDEVNYGQVLANHAHTKIENYQLLSEAYEYISLYRSDRIKKNQ